MEKYLMTISKWTSLCINSILERELVQYFNKNMQKKNTTVVIYLATLFLINTRKKLECSGRQMQHPL